jgi:glycosyltransferase involved in cell wall biosynthesis
MKYSVIIPYKDIVDLVVRAVQSVPDRPDIEVIIINNGTTELPASLFAGRHNVQVLWEAIGKGAGAARNVGLEHAKGEWLLMLDADDFFTENAFEIMDRYAEGEEDITFFYTTSCDSDSLAPSNRQEDTNELLDAYLQTKDEGGLRYGWSSPWAKMIKRSLVEEKQIRFDEIQVSNDVLFSVKTGFWAQSITASKEQIYCITTRQGSLTQTPNLKNLNERIDTSIRFNAFLKEHKIRQYRKSIMYLVYTIARNYGYREAIKTIWQSIKAGNNPFIGMSRWASTIRKNRHK